MVLHLTQDIRNGADVAVLDSFRGLILQGYLGVMSQDAHLAPAFHLVWL